MIKRLAAAVAILVVLVGVAGCGDEGSTATGVRDQRVQVVATYPHDVTSYTEGLQVVGDDRLLESAGLYGQSSLRETTISGGRVLRESPLPADQFAEGLTVVDGKVVQLTWKEHVAHIWDEASFSQVGTFDYDTEGWGLCYDGTHLVMSDGTSTLYFRDPQTFAVDRKVTVTNVGAPVDELNELECVDGTVYANVYQTDRIVQIDPADGHLIADVDASGLLSPTEAAQADVLNGIAYDPASDTFLITGKLWPTMFRVRFTDVG